QPHMAGIFGDPVVNSGRSMLKIRRNESLIREATGVRHRGFLVAFINRSMAGCTSGIWVVRYNGLARVRGRQPRKDPKNQETGKNQTQKRESGQTEHPSGNRRRSRSCSLNRDGQSAGGLTLLVDSLGSNRQTRNSLCSRFVAAARLRPD